MGEYRPIRNINKLGVFRSHFNLCGECSMTMGDSHAYLLRFVSFFRIQRRELFI